MLFIFSISKVNQEYEGMSSGYFERRIMDVKTFGTRAVAFVLPHYGIGKWSKKIM